MQDDYVFCSILNSDRAFKPTFEKDFKVSIVDIRKPGEIPAKKAIEYGEWGEYIRYKWPKDDDKDIEITIHHN